MNNFPIKPSQTFKKISNTFTKIAVSLIWTPNIPKYLQYFWFWISNLQYLAILIWAQLGSSQLDNQDISWTVFRFTKAVLFQDVISPEDNPLMICIYLYFLCLFLLFGYICYKVMHNCPFSQPAKLTIFMFCQLHLSFAFWTLNTVLIQSLTLNFQQARSAFSGIALYNSGFVVTHIILLTLNFVITYFMGFLSYDPFKNSNELAMHSPLFQVITLVFKSIMIRFKLVPESATKDLSTWTLTCLGFIISTIRHYDLAKTFPYYEFWPMSISLALSLISVLLSGLGCIFQVLRTFSEVSGITIVYAQVLLILLIVKYNQDILRKTLVRLLTLEDKHLSSENLVLKKVFAIVHIMKKTRISVDVQGNYNIKDLQFWGAWNYHQIEPQGTIANEGVESFRRTNAKAIDNMIFHILENAIQKLKSNTKLKIYLANYIVQQDINIIPGYDYVIQAISSNTFYNRIIASCLFEAYQQKVHSSFAETLDVKTLLEFEYMSSTFLKMIHSNSNRFVAFWKAYGKPQLEVKDLLKRSRDIEEADNAIKTYWTKFSHKDRFLPSSLRILYSVYSSIVRNTPYSSQKLQEEASQFSSYERKLTSQEEQTLTSETLASPDNILFHVSMTKGRVGKLLDLSSNITEQLGWKKQELIGKSLGVVLPQLNRERFIKTLMNHLNVTITNSKKHTGNIKSFIQDRHGYIRPGFCHIGFHPQLEHEIMYLLIARLPQSYEEQIIVSQDGSIQGFTRIIGTLLELQTDQKLNIHQFCTSTESLSFLQTDPVNILPNAVGDSKLSSDDKKEVTLSLFSMQSQTSQDYRVVITPFNYHNQTFFILEFVSLKPQDQAPSRSHIRQNTQINPHREHTNAEENELLSIASERPLQVFETSPSSPHALLHPTLENLKSNILTSPREQTMKMKTDRNKEDILSFRFISEETLQDGQSPRKTKPIDLLEKESTQPSSSGSNSKLQLEQVIYSIPKHNKFSTLDILFALLVLSACVVILILQSTNAETMQIIIGNVELIGASITRLNRLLNLFGVAVSFTLLDLNKIFDNRYSFLGVPSLRAVNMLLIKSSGQELIQANNNIANMMYKFDTKLSERLNTEFPVIDVTEQDVITTTRKMSSFSLITELGARVIRLAKRTRITTNNDTDIKFIIKNSINEVLVHCESGISIVVEDTQVKLDALDLLIQVATPVLGVLGLFLFYFLVRIVRIFKADRDKMLSVFRRLDEKEIVIHSNLVARFCSFLARYDMDIKTLSLNIHKEDFKVLAEKSRQSQIRREKPANNKGIDRILIKIIFSGFVVLLILFIVYSTTIILLQQQNKTVQRKINLMVMANLHLYELYLMWAVIYQYVGITTNVTIRNQPFDEEYDRVFGNLANMDADYLSVIDRDHGLGQDDDLVTLFTGNLCKVAISPLAASIGNPCMKMLGGLASRGIKAFEAFRKYKIQQMVTTYNNSAQTLQDQIKLLSDQDFIDGQGIMSAYILFACDKVNTRMQQQLSKDAAKFKENIQNLVIGSLLIYLSIVPFGWWRVRRLFMEEKVRWKKLLRLIPYHLVESDKTLKRYLLLSSEGKTYFNNLID